MIEDAKLVLPARRYVVEGISSYSGEIETLSSVTHIDMRRIIS